MIAFFAPAIYPCTIGGMEIYYFHLLNELSQKNEVVLFTTCRKYRKENCKVIPISSGIFLIKKRNLGNLSLFITTFFRLIFNSKKIQVIHVPCTSNSGFYGYFFPFIKKIFGIPYIIQFHGGGMRPWKKWDGNRLLFKHAAKVLTVSTAIKSEYEKRADREMEVVLPLIPYKKSEINKERIKIQYGYSEDDLIILMVGSIKPLKGNLWVYQEFKKLTKEFIEHHKLKLLFVGEGSDSSRLKETIIQDKMEDFIRVIDKIPNEKIYEVYHLADYYVIGSDFEGTPKSLLEAMYNSLPIIGTDVNGINNIIENRHNGLLVNKTQPGELKNAIQIMVENNDLAKQLGTNANKTYKEKYDFFVTLNRLTEVYHNVSNKYE